MTRSALLLQVLALIVTAPARAAAPEDAPGVVRLGLEETVARALASSARLGQLRAYEDAATAGLRGARAQRLPSLGFAAGYTRYSDVPEFQIFTLGQGQSVLYPNLPNHGRAQVELSLPLYTGGRTAAQILGAEEQRRATAEDLAAGQGDLVLEVTSAYWDLLAMRDKARVLGEAINSYEAHLKDATNFFESGLAARNDLLAVQVERDRAQLARLQAANGAEITNANLLRLLDLRPDARVEPILPETAAGAPAPATELLVAAAGEKRPELRALRARALAAEAALRAARAGTLPQASLQGGYELSNPNPRVFPLEGRWNETWSVGLAVSLTAFDGGRTSAACAQARAQAEAVRHQLEDLERKVRLEVTTRALELKTAQAARELAERNVEAARENVRVSQDRYQAGVSVSSDLLDAETRLLRAGLDETVATTDVHVAQAGLDRAVGR